MSTLDLSTRSVSVRKAALAAGWLVWLASLIALLLGTAIWFRWDGTPIAASAQVFHVDSQESLDFMSAYQEAIQALGLSLAAYAGLFAGLRLLAGLPFLITGAWLLRLRSERRMAAGFAAVLALLGAAGRWNDANWQSIQGLYSWAAFFLSSLNFLLECSLLLFYIFPDGRFFPRWTRWLAPLIVLLAFGHHFLTATPLNSNNWPEVVGVPLGSVYSLFFLLLGLAALTLRWRHTADTQPRQAAGWLLAGASLLIVVYLIFFIIYDTPLLAAQIQTPAQVLSATLILEPLWFAGQLWLAVCCWQAAKRL